MLDGMSDSIQRSRIENLHSREVDRQSPTGLFFFNLSSALRMGVIAGWGRHHGPCLGRKSPHAATVNRAVE